MKLTLGIFAAAALFASSADVDCDAIYKLTLNEVEANKESVVDIVSTQVEANQDCACEVTKAAIIASEADKALVGEIVSAAIVASPDNMRLISQCAIATAPDAMTEVQKVLAKFAPQAGGSYSAKGGYSAKNPKGGIAPAQEAAPAMANPLDGPTVIGATPFEPYFPIDEKGDGGLLRPGFWQDFSNSLVDGSNTIGSNSLASIGAAIGNSDLTLPELISGIEDGSIVLSSELINDGNALLNGGVADENGRVAGGDGTGLILGSTPLRPAEPQTTPSAL